MSEVVIILRFIRRLYMICTVAIFKEDDMFIAKDLRTSVVDQGDTIDEALSNLKEALELYYEDDDHIEDFEDVVFTTSVEVSV